MLNWFNWVNIASRMFCKIYIYIYIYIYARVNYLRTLLLLSMSKFFLSPMFNKCVINAFNYCLVLFMILY